jgi:hypothetical protein
VSDVIETCSPESAVCKAQYKLEEALRRGGWTDMGNGANNFSQAVALDIGASPGGWSRFLSDRLGVGRVIAVDNGPVEEGPGIEHWKMLGDQAIEILCQETPGVKLTFFVSDANIDPKLALDLLESAASLLMVGVTQVVVTFKNMYRTKKIWLEEKTTCFDRFEKMCLDGSAREVHLLTNTPNETTVLGIWGGKSSHQEEEGG